ncbi:MAG: Amidohydrolase [Thermodesulfobacteriota bacterium]|nr:Amidohydrolase [Thermodesulfobacteriota bacterium]
MVVDFHIHLFPQRVRENRGFFCSSDAGFASLYNSPKARMASEADIVAYLDQCGIDRGVVFGFPWESPELVKINNDEIWDFHEKTGGRIIPFAVVSCTDIASAHREAERTLKQGFAGLGELAFYSWGWTISLIESIQPILDVASHMKKPVLLHVNEPVGHTYPGKIRIDFEALVKLIERNPSVEFVLAHFGGGLFVYTMMPEINAIFSNTYVDTAASPYLYDQRVFATACSLLGPQKIIFGSDYPLLSLPRYLKDLDLANITADARAAILGGNAQRLLKIK